MNKKNFNSISQFSVPQNWIDDALNIPVEENKKKPILFVKFSRTFAAVACLVLVCCVSLMLFFLTDDNATPIYKPTQGVTSESETTETVSSENSSETIADTSNGETDYIGFIEPTEENISPNGTQSGENSSVNPSVRPTTEPTDKPIVGPTVKPTIEPSEDITEPVPTEPTSPPTEPDYPMPTVNPSYSPVPTEPIVEPTEPTEPWDPVPTEPMPPVVVPTVKPTENYNDIKVVGGIHTDKITSSGKVYCRFYDSNGNLLGSKNLFDSSHLTEIRESGAAITTVCYYPYRNNLITKDGYYTYEFYNSDGIVLRSYDSTYFKAP